MTADARHRLGLLLAGGALLAACASNPGTTQAGKPASKPPLPTGEPDCFYAREVQNFRVLDRANLIVYAPNEANAYRVSISPPSTDLRFADNLAFKPPVGRICGYAGERLIIGTGSSPDVVAIMNVSRLSRASLDALRAEGRGEGAPPAQPQPGPGADVEGAAGQAAPEAAPEAARNPPEK